MGGIVTFVYSIMHWFLVLIGFISFGSLKQLLLCKIKQHLKIPKGVLFTGKTDIGAFTTGI